MTGPCKYVLKHIRSLSDNKILELDYNHKSNIIGCARIPNKHVALKKYPGELSSIITQLISDGYLERAILLDVSPTDFEKLSTPLTLLIHSTRGKAQRIELQPTQIKKI